MPFYFRKSVSAGPFRFNFSQHGIGASVGVKGFRVGTGPRGHYVHAGRNGFYYRATIGQPSARTPTLAVVGQGPTYIDASGMIPITSGSVMTMQDSAFADVLQDINAKNHQIRLSFVFGMVATLCCGALLTNGGAIFLPSALLVLIAVALGAWLDSYKRAVVLFYDDEDVIGPIYRQFCAAFDGLISCVGKWHVQAAKPVYDLTTWKRQAGASRLVSRNSLSLGYQLPAIIKSNITPPSIQAGTKRIYFLPDMALIEEQGVFGAVAYDGLSLQSQASNFIEEQSVPRDTEVLYQTWQHPNKDGGPDRRFSSNRQLPVCRYELLHFTSTSGVNELFEFSRFGVAKPFIDAVRSVPRQSKQEIPLLPSAGYQGAPAIRLNPLLPRSATITLWAVSLASIVLIFVGIARMPPVQVSAPAQAVSKPVPQVMFVSALGLNCRSEPSIRGLVIKSLKRSERVSVTDQKDDWSRVIAGSNACWSRSSALSVSKPNATKTHHRKHTKVRSANAQSEGDSPKSPLPIIY